eukprot:116780-Pyramimonas_sp.AAC.1
MGKPPRHSPLSVRAAWAGLTTDQLKYKNPIHCATTILRERGPAGLWAGALPTVCRNGTNQVTP